MAGSLVRANGVELLAWPSGVGADPLALVHGSWVDHTTFDRLAPLLEPSLRLIRYDRRGHGRSERSTGPYSTRRDAADLGALLEALDLHPAHLVGHSLGGIVALRLALDRPELVRSVVLHEPPLFALIPSDDPELRAIREAADDVAARIADGDRRGAARAFVEEVGMGPGDWPRLAPAVQELLVAHADRWLDEASATDTFDLPVTELAGFDPPVLVTVGSVSRPIYRAIADRVVAALPNARRRELVGAGHLPHVSHPALFAAAIIDFTLDRIIPTS